MLTTTLCQAATHYASIIDNMEFGLNWLVRPLYQNVMIEGIECFGRIVLILFKVQIKSLTVAG